ncbi:hypothetical protein J6590_044101 [Homalodisca vitripennis]|nr:hypothetical protein J6590_044101 [Homalodisca vitripennis]
MPMLKVLLCATRSEERAHYILGESHLAGQGKASRSRWRCFLRISGTDWVIGARIRLVWVGSLIRGNFWHNLSAWNESRQDFVPPDFFSIQPILSADIVISTCTITGGGKWTGVGWGGLR